MEYQTIAICHHTPLSQTNFCSDRRAGSIRLTRRLFGRFFYDNTGLESSFTAAQLAELKQSSLARIYCDNLQSEGLKHIQPLAFLQPGFFKNDRQSCDAQAIPRVDLSVF